MEWLNTLIKKLPTLKGIGDFFYVATHWSTISAERDEYRRQIKDREEWHQSYKTNVEAIHDIEKKRIEAETQETQQQIDTIAAQVGQNNEKLIFIREGLEEIADSIEELRNSNLQGAIRLAIVYYCDPLLWDVERIRLPPALLKPVEQIMGMLGQRLRNLSADQTLRETLLESLPLSVNRNKKT